MRHRVPCSSDSSHEGRGAVGAKLVRHTCAVQQ